MSCRSCAAFFRRAAGSPRRKTECPIGDCQVLEDGKFQCKLCRLKRCFDVGMDPTKIQSNRDLISTSSKFPKRVVGPPESLSTFLGRPTFILCCEPDKASDFNSYIDVRYLLDKAYVMFKQEFSRPFQYQNSLEKLSLTLDDMRLRQPFEKLLKIRKVGKEESMYITEQAFLRTVEWFSTISEFNELDEFVKLEIVKSAWYCWTRLEKLTETADYQRRKVFSEDTFMVGNDTCLDACNYEIDLSWCTNYSLDQLLFYIPPQEEQNTRKCVQDLVDLNPSGIEVNYMLLQVSLSHVGKKCQGKVLEACEKLMQSQADNLHDSYVKMKQPNYAGRLAKMLKINKVIEEDIRNRAERNKLAKIFNVIKIDYSHPEMFELC